jgi:hypothetical protein
VKSLLLLPLLFISLTTFAQKSFVGLTKDKVKDYWSTRISSEYYDEGTYTDHPDTEFFLICQKCGSGSYMTMNADFSADFKNNICISNSYGIKSQDLSVYIARINKAGYKWNEEKQGWIDAAHKQLWKIEGSSQTGHTLTISTLTPDKATPLKAVSTLAPSKKLGFTDLECIDALTKQGVPLTDIKGEHITTEADKLTYKTDQIETNWYFRNGKCYQVEYIYDNKDAAMKFLSQLKANKTLKQSESSLGVWDSITENITYLYYGEESGKYTFAITKQNKSL